MNASIAGVMETNRPFPHLGLVAWDHALSAPECDAIIALGHAAPLGETVVVDQAALVGHRVCDTRLIADLPETRPLYDLLWSAAAHAAEHAYGFRMTRIAREPHYVEYRGGAGHFHWHNDYSHESDEAPRKVTVVIQLSDPWDYGGGDFETFGPIGETAPRARGTIFCLPSIVPHRVTPVTRGMRRALVAWVAGPRFR